MMKKFVCLCISFVCILLSIGCHSSEKYRVTIQSNFSVENKPKSFYEAEEEVTIKLPIVTEQYYTVYVNGKKLEHYDSSDTRFLYYKFIMPHENVVIMIEEVDVEIPQERQRN